MEEKFSLIKYTNLLSIRIGWMVDVVSVGKKSGKAWYNELEDVSSM
jgi:hypothetical protein